MAARRIAGPTINWAAIAERVPETEKSVFLAFKTKSDQYLRRMMANPEAMPKLDWGFYKKNVAVAGVVDKFQKEFDALKIPYPEDKYTSAVDAQEKEVLAAVKNYIAQSNQRISEYESEVSRIKSLLPFDQMTLEDYKDAYPELSINAENPSYWPHNPESQLTEEDKKSIAG